MQNKLNTGTLEEIIQTVSNAVKLTHDRIRFVRSTKREEPHIKLLIIDLVNYLMGLLGNEERKILV
jgi:hypothetical protein